MARMSIDHAMVEKRIEGASGLPLGQHERQIGFPSTATPSLTTTKQVQRARTREASDGAFGSIGQLVRLTTYPGSIDTL